MPVSAVHRAVVSAPLDRALALAALALEEARRDPARALALALQAEGAARSLGPTARLAARFARARALYVCSRYRDSARLFAQVRRERERRGELAAAAAAGSSLISPLLYLGDVEGARQAARHALALHRRAGDRLGEGKLHANYAILLQRSERFAEALAQYRRARALLARHGGEEHLPVVDLNTAQVHSLLGHPRRARRLFARARAALVGRGQQALVASVDYNAACDHLTCGHFDRAWEGLQAALLAFESLGDRSGVAHASLDLATLALGLGAAGEARELAGRARRDFEELGVIVESARALSIEAAARARLGDRVSSRLALMRAVAALAAHGQRLPAALARLDLASLELERDPALSRLLAGQSARCLERRGLRHPALGARIVEATAAARLSPRGGRRQLRRLLGRTRRLGAADLSWRAAAALARLELDAGRRHRALRLAEGALADVDRLRTDLRRPDLAGWALADRMHVYDLALRLEVGRGRAARALHLAERARSRRLADSLATAGRAEPAASVPPVLELQGGLAPDQQLIEFQRVGEELWAFTATRRRVEATRVAERSELIDARIAELRFHIGAFQHGPEFRLRQGEALTRLAEALLAELGRLLLAPLRPLLRGRRLIVVPTGALHELPFAALPLGGRVLLEQAEIGHAPSALVHLLLGRGPARGIRPPLVVGVGDPAAPQAEAEAAEVAGLFARSRLLLGPAAARETFRREVRGRRIIHIAVHGRFTPEGPAPSSLKLGDGWLGARDILELKLGAELVTLAACQSGRGLIRAGDDSLGLVSSFLQAGARAVLASLWWVEDASARGLMRSTYARRLAGDPWSTALRRSQLELRARLPHPFYWAAYTLTGAA